MSISASMVKDLREKTGAPIMDCKRALQEAHGDLSEAIKRLRIKGVATATKRSGKVTNEGVVTSYIHLDGRLGVLVEVNCETDFVAKTKDFQEVSKNIAMQIAASNPRFISREDVSEERAKEELNIFVEQAQKAGKPERVWMKIAEGKLNKFFEEVCLLEQSYIRNPKIKVQDYINEAINRLGENIVVRRFVRYKLGETE